MVFHIQENRCLIEFLREIFNLFLVICSYNRILVNLQKLPHFQKKKKKTISLVINANEWIQTIFIE